MKIKSFREDYAYRQAKFLSIPEEIDYHLIKTQDEVILSIDGSTSSTGITVINKKYCVPLCCINLVSDYDKQTNAYVRYKIDFKKIIVDMLDTWNVSVVVYEQPVLDNTNSIAALFSLATSLEEIVVENEPKYNKLQIIKIENTWWKSKIIFTRPYISDGTWQKEQARSIMTARFGMWMSHMVLDITDSCSMGVAYLENEEEFEEKTRRKKASKRKYKYAKKFYFCDSDEEFCRQVLQYNIKPKDIYNLGKNEKLDMGVYYSMDNPVEKKVTAIKFKYGTHGDIMIQENLANKGKGHEYIYVVALR